MRRNVRKLNKQIGKHVSKYSTIPVPLQPLPLTYEPQAPTERKVNYNRKSIAENLPMLPISAVSMKTDDNPAESAFGLCSSTDGVKISTSLLDSPSGGGLEIGSDKQFTSDPNGSDEVLLMEPCNQIVTHNERKLQSQSNQTGGQGSGQLELDARDSGTERGNKSIKPKKKPSVRKAVNLAGLRLHTLTCGSYSM